MSMSAHHAFSREEGLTLEFIRLMTPLVVHGGLTVRVHGKPAASEEHMALSRVLKAVPHRERHKQRSVAVLEILFNNAPSSHSIVSATHFCVILNAIDVRAQARRVHCCIAFFAAFLLLSVLHQTRCRNVAHGAIISKHI